MDSKFYVSLEVAKLLKEKGYNESTEYLHLDNIMYKGVCLNYLKPELCGGMIIEDNISYPCPTKAEAIDWLESKGVIVDVDYYPNREKWSADICRKSGQAYMNIGKYYLTRLEAEEAAIIKALELL